MKNTEYLLRIFQGRASLDLTKRGQFVEKNVLRIDKFQQKIDNNKCHNNLNIYYIASCFNNRNNFKIKELSGGGKSEQ